MAWSHTIDVPGYFLRAKITSNLDKSYGSWAALGPEKQNVLTSAVRLAPEMVTAAIARLKEYEGRLMSTTGADMREDEVWIGVAKYFSLFNYTTEEYFVRILQITRVLDIVLDGMMNHVDAADGYVVKLIDRGADGFKAGVQKDESVTMPGTTPSMIRQVLGYPDEYGHVPWNPMIGPICLNVNYYFGAGLAIATTDTLPVWMARTIVHEGTHKWARTKDIMYKHSSVGYAATQFNKTAKTWIDKGQAPFSYKSETIKKAQKTNDELKKKGEPTKTLPTDAEILQAFLATDFVNMATQGKEQFANADAHVVPDVPGREGKLRPHTGLKKGLVTMAGKQSHEGVGRTDPNRWLENADSYAWFVRRMWKRTQGKG